MCGSFLAAQVCHGQGAAEEGVSAKLDATVTAGGVLEGTIVIVAKGAASWTYRQAFLPGGKGLNSHDLFGEFVQNRKPNFPPAVTEEGGSDPPVQVRMAIREEDFILPIERVHSLVLDLLPLVAEITSQPDGSLRLGAVGRVREEVELAIPADFTLSAGSHTDMEREFARYRSDAKVENGHLIIRREVQLKEATIAGSSRAEADALWKAVEDDQRRAFVPRRVRRADTEAWVASLPAERAASYGLRAYQQHEYEAARQLLERALKARPGDALAWNNLGRALAALGRLEEAQTAYEKQMAVHPDDAYAHNNLGLVQERLGYWDAAISSFRKQLEVHPGDASAIVNLPRALIHEQRWAEVEEAALKASQVQPNNVQQRLNVAVARVCQGKAEKARQEIDAVLGGEPSATLLNGAAYDLIQCGRENKLAEAYAKRALEKAESDSDASRSKSISAAINSQRSLASCLETYGWLVFQKGDTKRALKILEASVALWPRAEAYAHLADAETRNGREEEATRYWRQATFLAPGQTQHAPPAIATRLESITPLSLDRAWYPLPAEALNGAAQELGNGESSYFYVIAGGDGAVETVRALDSEAAAAQRIAPAVRQIHFPAVETERGPARTVHIVRVAKSSDGKVVAAQSVSAEAVAIASYLAPAEFPQPAPSPAPTKPEIYKIGAGITPPRLLRQVEPQYAEKARRAGVEGTVLLKAVVAPDGKAHDLQVMRSLGHGLDEKAIEAVSQWEFAPGIKDGKPVAIQVTIEVNFRLLKGRRH